MLFPLNCPALSYLTSAANSKPNPADPLSNPSPTPDIVPPEAPPEPLPNDPPADTPGASTPMRQRRLKAADWDYVTTVRPQWTQRWNREITSP